MNNKVKERKKELFSDDAYVNGLGKKLVCKNCGKVFTYIKGDIQKVYYGYRVVCYRCNTPYPIDIEE